MNVSIKVIPHDKQRYKTPGDWLLNEDGNLEIYVSCLGDWREEMLVAFHELREALVCKHRGISQQAVDDFDMLYEQDRAQGRHGPEDEPGDDPKACYFQSHQLATAAERSLAYDLDVAWNEYGNHILNLDEK